MRSRIALGAYVAARLLLKTAERIGRALAQPQPLHGLSRIFAAPVTAALRARAVVAGCSSRGPPLAFVAN